MKIEFSRQFFEKYTNITFHKNWESSCSMRKEGGADGQKDMTMLIAVFRNFAKVHNKHDFCKLSEDKIRGSHSCKQNCVLKYDDV